MYLFAELQMQGNKHVEVNAGLLQIIIDSFAQQDGIVISDNYHAKILQGKINKAEHLKFDTFQYSGDKELKKTYTPIKVWRELKLMNRCFRIAKKNRAEVIVFASAFPFTAPFMNIYSNLYRQRIIVGMHGDLGILSVKKSKLTTQIVRKTISMFLRKRSRYTTLLFYGEPIRKKLFELFPSIYKKNTIAIDHPYSFNVDFVEKKLTKPIIIASIGTSIITKNSHFIYETAQYQKQNITNNKIQFIQIGNVSNQVMSFSNNLVERFSSSQNFLLFNEFEKGLRNANYFIFFMTNNSYYDLCPSGTLFDALKYCTPIISLKNPFFEYYFKLFGNIGYLCENVQEMSELISHILSTNNSKEYSLQQYNLLTARNRISIDVLKDSFERQYLNLTK